MLLSVQRLKKRWICNKLMANFENYFYRHSERRSQHAEIKAAEARFKLKTQLLLLANIQNHNYLHILIYKVQMFYSPKSYSKTYVLFLFSIGSFECLY